VTVSAAALLELVRTELGAEYEVLRPLGEGGMGAVYLARERALQRLVAIKVLDPDLGASPVFRARFEREARTAAQLTHPNIVAIYRVGAVGPLAYFVMQYVDGLSLADRLRGAGRLSLATALRWGAEIAAALGAAHRRGVIHRDVKPQNVLVDTETGRCMVTDFGIASVAGAADRSMTASDEPLTGAGMVMGTPRYMSPEQATGVRDLPATSDLYALGVVLYEMLSGAYPYKVGDPPNFLLAHLTQKMIPLVTRIGDMPREVERVIAQLLEKEPADRVRSAEALAEELHLLLGELRDEPPPFAGRGRAGRGRRGARWLQRRWQLASGGVVLAAALAIGVPMLLKARGQVPNGIDARRSILLGFFQNSTPDRELDWLRIGGVEYLVQSLSRWKDLRVVDPERLLDLARRAALTEGAPLSQGEAIELARRAGAWTATVGSVIRADDSLRITLRVYDVATRAQVGTLQATAADEDALPAAFGRLAAQVLALAGAPADIRESLDPPTRSVAAYKAYVEGIAARSRWQLGQAVSAFQRAVTLDTTFALAHYELSQALGAQGDAFRSDRLFAYADTAVLRSESRPERERLLLRAYQAFLRADLTSARTLYQQVLTVDSTSVDALVGLADVSAYDRTLVKDARGTRIPANLTLALRLYERALSLDANDHRTYASLVDLLAAAGQPEATIGGYAEPPSGNFTTFFLRIPARTWAVLLRGDSLQLVPTDSLLLRFAPKTVDSLRAAARRRASAVIAQWQSRAPGEGQPYAVRATLRVLDRNYDGALADLDEAERRGAAMAVPAAYSRLAFLLEARRFRAAASLADSLAGPRGDREAIPDFALGPQLTMLAVQGRIAEALSGVDRQLADLRTRNPQGSMLRRIDISMILRPLRLNAVLGTLTLAQVREAAQKVEARLDAAAESERSELRTSAARSLAFAAASVGDTTTTREWQRGAPGIEFSVEIAAWAAVNAGDPRSAARVLAALPSDTVRSPTRLYARALAERALGRPAAALRSLGALDSAVVQIGGGSVADWLLLSKAVQQRAELSEAAGDVPRALAGYRLVADLWARADPVLQPERRRVLAAIAALASAGDRSAGAPLTNARAAPLR
jgi:serine/threonine-protein kinase